MLTRRLALATVFTLASRIAGAQAPPAARATTWHADNGNGTFTNPLFYDEFSDPDLIRVGDDYYLTGTTMHSMPGLPVLRSRDLVNWRFVSYASPTLDLGPAFRLEDGKQIYGQGIWAPSLRYHAGVFHIFSNVNGLTTQHFTATRAEGPWTRTPMKRSFHDLSVLFDDDGKTYVVWGYQSIRLAQLNEELTDVVAGTEREIIPKSAGMGEGLHLYKIDGKYLITSAWFQDRMRMPAARADHIEGPYEVNEAISIDEDFGLAQGYRLSGREPPFTIRPPNGSPGHMSLHQGGLVQTQTGEWWGFSMMDYNSVGRLTALSPITWKDGWPYFGLPGNLRRTPRTWVKPNTGNTSPPVAPFQRSDDFADPTLKPVWQWNHVPVDSAWSLAERRGFLRLHSLPALSLWSARNTLTQRAMGPRSAATVTLDVGGMRSGDVAGLALFNRPFAWIGVARTDSGTFVEQFDEQTGKTARVALSGSRVWLHADCDFLTEKARWSYSTDGRSFEPFGAEFTMVFQLTTFQGVRYALFHYQTGGRTGGVADFGAFDLTEPDPRGLMRAIPVGERIALTSHLGTRRLVVRDGAFHALEAGRSSFRVLDRGHGRVALETEGQLITVEPDGRTGLRRGRPSPRETFQWTETPTGELVLMSLVTNRFLRIDQATGAVVADSPGPRPDGLDGVRFDWSRAP